MKFTVLGSLCRTQCETTYGVKLLLEDSRTDVNKGQRALTPLCCALKNIAEENDYFYQVAQLLLNHKNIDINAKCTFVFRAVDWGHLGHVWPPTSDKRSAFWKWKKVDMDNVDVLKKNFA